jgi:tetratricopeptide (TPR) repeat protein
VWSTYAQTPTRLDADVRTDLASALRVARPLIREDPQRAIQLLKKLEEEYPTNSQVLLLLGEAYRVSGDAVAAQQSYEKCLQHHPTHLQAGASLGLLYAQDGNDAKAEATFEELLERTAHGVNTYRTIASTLSRHGYVDRALSYYEKGRAKNKQNYILTLDIAYVHKSMGNYKQSLTEYLLVIETAPKQHRLVKSRIADLLHDPAADQEALIGILEKQVTKDAPNRTIIMEILATTYLDRGMLESALDMAILADEGEGSTGVVLFNIAELTIQQYQSQPPGERARYFDMGLRALEVYLDRHPESPQVPSAKLMLIELLVELASGRVKGRPSMELQAAIVRALNALDWIIESFPGTDYAERAFLKKGDVVFRIQNQPEKALEIYKLGMRSSRFHRTAFAERLGRVYLIVERYDEAQEHFAQLVNSEDPDLHETGVFYSGLMLSFTKDYEAARDTLTALAEANPSSQFTNDAIHLAWVIEEGLQGDQRVLGGYITALRSELADDSLRAMSELEKIAELPIDTPLRPRSLIKLGEMYQGQGDYDVALKTFETFVADYPQDTRSADVYRKIGQVYEDGYGNVDLALKKYEDILVSFPYYIFLDEVREDVTRLRAHQGEN